jgi:hypothetical protein
LPELRYPLLRSSVITTLFFSTVLGCTVMPRTTLQVDKIIFTNRICTHEAFDDPKISFKVTISNMSSDPIEFELMPCLPSDSQVILPTIFVGADSNNQLFGCCSNSSTTTFRVESNSAKSIVVDLSNHFNTINSLADLRAFYHRKLIGQKLHVKFEKSVPTITCALDSTIVEEYYLDKQLISVSDTSNMNNSVYRTWLKQQR